MDDVAIGRTLRSIRVRLRLRQADLAARTGLSQQLVSLLETGGLDHVSVRTARAVARALGAELVVTVRWRGAELDRVRDEDHARIVAAVAALLESLGWVVQPEVTYSRYGERGSIDLLAFHPPTGSLLVVEVKTELVSVEETLRRLDAKVRLAQGIAGERFGWRVSNVSRLLAIAEGRTARRRVQRHEGVFARAMPMRGHAARAWLARPSGRAGLLVFMSSTTEAGARRGSATPRRVRQPRARTNAE
jgi:transcriptional regulator with XRE-family HTH domain